MSTLRPPSTSPSPSPAPQGNNSNNNNNTGSSNNHGNALGGGGHSSGRSSARASMGPSSRPAPLNPVNPPASPRPGPGSGRPTSELLGSAGMFQTPEAEAIDQWFENLQNYEATLEEMAAASLDVNFKEELSAIEQWFRVLSEAERTAALYSLLQHSTQVQIRFFITVLQQMARSDPMTALLSPNVGGSMQSQMEAKLAQMGLKSPGLKSPIPASPQPRSSFGGGSNPANRQSLAIDSTGSSSFLSPDTANTNSPNSNNANNNSSNNNTSVSGGGNDAAATLVQQRAKLKANAAHRISAPVLASSAGAGDRSSNVWSSAVAAAGGLSQVAERNSDSPVQELTVPSTTNTTTTTISGSRPKSTDFTGLANSLRSPPLRGNSGDENNSASSIAAPGNMSGEQVLSPMVGGNWASMVNTPLVPMFDASSQAGKQNLDAAATKLSTWQLDDARKFRRPPKNNSGSGGHGPSAGAANGGANGAGNNAIYGDDGNMIQSGRNNNNLGARNAFGQGGAGAGGGGGGWPNGARSPALSSVSSNRFGGSDHEGGSNAGMNGLGNVGGFVGMPSPGLGMAAGLAGMGQLNPFGMNMLQNMNNMNAMAAAMGGLSPEAQAQLLAAQMAAMSAGAGPGVGVGGFMGMAGMGGVGGFGLGMQPGVTPVSRSSNRSGTGGGGRSSSGKSANGRDGGGGAGGAGGKDKDEDFDPALLGDVPAWLRSLRLHKYTPNFEGMKWRDMVIMDEAQLEAKGVAALGARRKMLKTFEAVRSKMGVELPPGTTITVPPA